MPKRRRTDRPAARYAQALRDAARTLGGSQRLAAVLKVPAERPDAWLSATRCRRADGPYAPRPLRRIRVER